MPPVPAAASAGRTATHPPGSRGRRSARPAAVAALWTRTPRPQHPRTTAGIARRDGPAGAKDGGSGVVEKDPLSGGAGPAGGAQVLVEELAWFHRCRPAQRPGHTGELGALPGQLVAGPAAH